jgi:nicotinamidase-related amidase
MYTLVVVDMQDKFVASRAPKVQEACKRAVAKAIQQRATIVFVEFDNYGPTIPKLTKLTKGYPNVMHVSKGDWDGSSQALKALKDRGVEYRKFKVCGVYTECCVAATAKGIADRVANSRVEVIRSACWSSNMDDHQYGLKQMNGYKQKVRFAR